MRNISRSGSGFPLQGPDRVMLQRTIRSSGQLDLESSNSLNRTVRKGVTKKINRHLGDWPGNLLQFLDQTGVQPGVLMDLALFLRSICT